MKRFLNLIIALAMMCLLIVWFCVFLVDQRQYALVFQLGEIVRIVDSPGVKFKMPLYQNVMYFDKRIQTIDTVTPERFLTSEKQNMQVDHFVKWRIIDPKLYYESVGGDVSRARIRLLQTVNAGLREEFGRRTMANVVSGERNVIMDVMRERADGDARKIGVEILDVRLKRVDFQPEVSEGVYQRMVAERKSQANKLRAGGEAISEQIKADADKQREVMLAEAFRDAQRLMGEGDALATDIYAEAYGQDPEFYAFYRRMEAYKNSFNDGNGIFMLDPGSDFFKYFRQPENSR